MDFIKNNGHVSEERMSAEHEAWMRIIKDARARFPHEQEVLYQLRVWYHASERPRYPKFRLINGERFLFRTLADAERQIAEIVASKSVSGDRPSGMRSAVAAPYCFLVEEIPLGRRQWHSESQAWRRYDGAGRPVVSSLASEMDYEDGLEPFFGRLPESCPVRRGDIVEVMRGEEVVLEIVIHLPPDPGRVLRMYADKDGKYPDGNAPRHPLDFTDDSYITLDGSVAEGRDTYMLAHGHPHTKQVFPAGRKVPDRVRRRLETCLLRVEVLKLPGSGSTDI